MLPPPPPGKEKKAEGGCGARPVDGFFTPLLLMLPTVVRLPCFPPGGVPKARGGGRMGTIGPEAKGSEEAGGAAVIAN